MIRNTTIWPTLRKPEPIRIATVPVPVVGLPDWNARLHAWVTR